MRDAPAFCPYVDCKYHDRPVAEFYQLHGTFRATARRRPTQRYRCRGCNRTFSEQTLRFDYRILRPELERRLLEKLSRDDRALVAHKGVRLKVSRLAARLLDGPVTHRAPLRRRASGAGRRS